MILNDAHHYFYKFIILNQNNFPFLFSDNEGGATCHSHVISQ